MIVISLAVLSIGAKMIDGGKFKKIRLSKDIRDVMMQNLKDKLKELNEELKTI